MNYKVQVSTTNRLNLGDKIQIVSVPDTGYLQISKVSTAFLLTTPTIRFQKNNEIEIQGWVADEQSGEKKAVTIVIA